VEQVELMPQGAIENLELKAENRTLKDDAEQTVNYHVHMYQYILSFQLIYLNGNKSYNFILLSGSRG
jgi:hypothetical protein